MKNVFVNGDICRVLQQSKIALLLGRNLDSGHFFEDGEIVRIIVDEPDDDGHIRAEYMDEHDYWYVFPHELEFVTGVENA
jgi:hypothetical protein